MNKFVENLLFVLVLMGYVERAKPSLIQHLAAIQQNIFSRRANLKRTIALFADI